MEVSLNTIQHNIVGAWKLSHFEDQSEQTRLKFNDILIFTQKYYSDFQSQRGSTEKILCHIGMYRLSGNQISFQIQQSNDPDYIGRVAAGMIDLKDNLLIISFSHGARPGVWFYDRISD